MRSVRDPPFFFELGGWGAVLGLRVEDRPRGVQLSNEEGFPNFKRGMLPDMCLCP